MEKQFVTYEIALAIKELGFDKIFRFGSDASLYNSKGEHIFYSNYGFMSSGLSDGYISAPLWQQIIDWFREKHNLLIHSPKPDEWNNGKWAVKINSLDNSIIIAKFGSQPDWDIYRCINSYEEAREQVVLKAIELVKNKSL